MSPKVRPEKKIQNSICWRKKTSPKEKKWILFGRENMNPGGGVVSKEKGRNMKKG
jgi:hypothetical protein